MKVTTKRTGTLAGKRKEVWRKSAGRVREALQSIDDITTLLKDKLGVVRAIKNGVSYEVVEEFRDQVGISNSQMCTVLNVSAKSLQRFKSNKTILKPVYSERFFGLAEVYQQGNEVFGKIEIFNDWLQAENYALGSMRPMDLLSDSFGKDLVLGELVRIDDGILV